MSDKSTKMGRRATEGPPVQGFLDNEREAAANANRGKAPRRPSGPGQSSGSYGTNVNGDAEGPGKGLPYIKIKHKGYGR